METPIDDVVILSATVFKKLKVLKIHKRIGVDNIPTVILKEYADILCNSLTILFNYSISSGMVPSEWKTARIVPVFKKGNKSDCSNYRPIDLLPIVSKVLASCILDIIYPKLESYIYPLQHGFIPGQ